MFNAREFAMQGVVFMPENPQQGSPPPNNSIDSSMTMESPPDAHAKDKLANQSRDSGIFSTTSASLEPAEADARSDCSSPDRKYVCPICDTMLTSQHQFTLHIRSHNTAAEERADGYACRICRKVLSSSSSLDRHVLVHSGERPFPCRHCGDTFTTNGNMHRHMRTHRADSDDAESSPSEYNNNRPPKRRASEPRELAAKRQRASSESDAAGYRCPVCERADFDSVRVLENHLEDNHPDHPANRPARHQPQAGKPVDGFRDLTFVDFSSEKFPHIARYECERSLHKIVGPTTVKFECTKCERAFPCASSLDFHISECLTDGELDLARVPITDSEVRRNEFFTRLDLQDNSPEKGVNETSNKLRRQLLSRAMAIDSGKDLADIQSIISMTSGPLLQPLKVEAEGGRGELEEESQDVFAVEFRKMKLRGEFPCRLCTAVFPNLRALKGHNRAHLNGGNSGLYRCNMCPHSSIDKAALIRHMRTHNGDRPYECSLCNYAFTTKANCERHLRNRHGKTTREEVKKSIIYHPSEDPTNEDLNKLTGKEDLKKSTEDLHCTTPKLSEFQTESLSSSPSLTKDPLTISPEQPKFLSKINDIIRSENLKSLKDIRVQNGHISTFLPTPYTFSPKSSNVSTPTPIPPKIHVKSLDLLKETSYEQSDDEDSCEPMDLVLDLSKKPSSEKKPTNNQPEDLSQKHHSPLNLFAQQFLKMPAKNDPAAFYAQLALCRQNFGAIPSWPPFPFNPLLMQTLQNSLLQPEQEMRHPFNVYGGSIVAEHGERLKKLANPGLNPYSLYNLPELKPEAGFGKKPEETAPLSLSVDGGPYGEPYKLHSPLPAKSDMAQSPNSVKMVIKNGVLMPKQKQRRYRTERPFSCEHCSARFTLRSNMERHIKQQHPQFWSQRQRGHVGHVGRKSSAPKSEPGFEGEKRHEFEEQQHEKLKYALLAQQLGNGGGFEVKREPEDEESALVIDEKSARSEEASTLQRNCEKSRILEDKLKELHAKQMKIEAKAKSEEDLVPVARLLDNASQQPFKNYFGREQEEPEVGASEEDEEGLVASGSTSEGNVSGTDENKSESETIVPVKKKSAYSMAPNRVSCPFCNRKFPWSSSLRRHILTHTGQKPFKCSHCPLLFTTKSNCDRHLLRKHGSAATTISNDPPAPAAGYLMRNVPERPFKCATCPSSTFSTHSNLKKHIGSKHAPNAHGDDIRARGYDAGSSEDERLAPPEPEPREAHDLPFKCHLCEGSFAERQAALDHIGARHPAEFGLLMAKNALDAPPPPEDDDGDMRRKFSDYPNRKVICAFCMRRFWSAEDLRRHMRTHTGERPFSCDICGRRFTLKHSMLRHRKKHDVKNFDNENNYSDEDAGFEKQPGEGVKAEKEESDGNEGGDLISNLLGIRDRSFIDKVLTASPDDAAKLLGVKNGVKE